MSNINDAMIARMQSLMTYGTQQETKQFKSDILEHVNKGSDGKTYGIIREGTKYVIKVMNDGSKPVIAENFDYIGGFSQKGKYSYDSYGMAIKQFDLKMLSLKEAYNPNKGMIIESLDPNRKEYLFLEGVDEMKKEIARQRQIMMNAQIIQEGKNSGPKRECGECGNAKDKGLPFGGKDSKEKNVEADEEPYNKDGEPKKMNEAEALAWNDNKDYMDKSHGTEIGDGTPFNKCPKSQKDCEAKEGTVVESVEEPAPNEVNNWDKGLPKQEGTGKVETSDGKPFDKKVNESMFEDDDLSTEDPIDDMNQQDASTELDNVEDDVEDTIEDEDSSIESMMREILDKLNDITSKIDANQYSDEPLYDDDEGDDNAIEGNEGEADNLPSDRDSLDDGEDDDEFDVYESRDYKKLMEDRTTLNDFGKHPAYQKEPFTYPNPNHNEKEGYHDWNDESVKGKKPYGEKIGDGTPFNQDPEAINNAIAEGVAKALKELLSSKKKNK